MADFVSQIFGGMYFSLFTLFLYYLWSKSVICFDPIKILAKKGKKRVLYTFWSKSIQISKFQFFPKIALFRTLFTPFAHFSYKRGPFTNSTYFMLKKISKYTIPFFGGNFGDILVKFWPKMSDFCDAHFKHMDRFSFLLPFNNIYGE